MKQWTALLLGLFLSFSATAQTDVTQFKLNNGLTVVLKPDHRSQSATLQVWYKVGSSYEPPGLGGISHLLEHLLFQGTKNHSADDFAKIMQSVGAESNAMTSDDFTMYHETLLKKNLSTAFRLEADRMQNVVFNQKIFEKERQVVMEERRLRTDDQPIASTYELFKATAQVAHPYHNPVVGWMSDLKKMSMQQAEMWYTDWYVPSNAILVVSGDLKADEVKTLAEKYFGSIPSGHVPDHSFQLNPPTKGIKKIVVNAPANLPWLILGYNVPVYKTAENKKDAYALQVLSSVLSSGENSMFVRDLVRKQHLVGGADIDYSIAQRLNGLFTIMASPLSGIKLETVKQALFDEIKYLQSNKLSNKELRRAQRQLLASDTYQKDSQFYLAFELGRALVVNIPLEWVDGWVANIKAVTPADIQRVAKKYLIDNRLTVGELHPIPGKIPENTVESLEGVKSVH